MVPAWTLDTVADLAVCEGRLTLVSGQPLGSGSGTTIYFTPYNGNLIGFQQGQIISFSEKSIAVPTTGLYDVFAYNNSGTLTLELSNSWSVTGNLTGSDGSRTDALTLTNGVYYKSADSTRRYLGTFYSVSGTAYDNNQFRLLWNQYNQVPKRLTVNDPVANYTFTTVGVTVRPINNNTNNSIQVVSGNPPSTQLSMGFGVYGSVVTNSFYQLFFGYDSTTGMSKDYNFQLQNLGATLAEFSGFPNIGLHTYYLNEWLNVGAGGTIIISCAGNMGMGGIFYC